MFRLKLFFLMVMMAISSHAFLPFDLPFRSTQLIHLSAFLENRLGLEDEEWEEALIQEFLHFHEGLEESELALISPSLIFEEHRPVLFHVNVFRDCFCRRGFLNTKNFLTQFKLNFLDKNNIFSENSEEEDGTRELLSLNKDYKKIIDFICSQDLKEQLSIRDHFVDPYSDVSERCSRQIYAFKKFKEHLRSYCFLQLQKLSADIGPDAEYLINVHRDMANMGYFLQKYKEIFATIEFERLCFKAIFRDRVRPQYVLKTRTEFEYATLAAECFFLAEMFELAAQTSSCEMYSEEDVETDDEERVEIESASLTKKNRNKFRKKIQKKINNAAHYLF